MSAQEIERERLSRCLCGNRTTERLDREEACCLFAQSLARAVERGKQTRRPSRYSHMSQEDLAYVRDDYEAELRAEQEQDAREAEAPGPREDHGFWPWITDDETRDPIHSPRGWRMEGN